MKKHVIWTITACALLGAASCQTLPEEDFQQKSFVEKEQESEQPALCVVSAMMEDPSGTKTSLEGNIVLWSEGDQIKIFNSDNPQGVTYSLTEGAGSGSASFTGEVLSGTGPYYAVYPASVAGELDWEVVSVDLPQVQELTTDSFDNGANVAMAVSESLGGNIVFKNVLGAVSFTLNTDAAIRSVRVQTRGNEALWGHGYIGLENEVPQLTLDAADTDHQSITLAGDPKQGPFYLMLPPASLADGFMVELVDDSSMAMVLGGRAPSGSSVKRNHFLAMPELTFTPKIKAGFLEAKDVTLGYFQNIGQSGQMQAFTYDKFTCQYAWKDMGNEVRYNRVQSLPLGKMFSITLPVSLQLGMRYEGVATQTLSGSTWQETDNATYLVVRTTSQAAWLVSADATNGFILKQED